MWAKIKRWFYKLIGRKSKVDEVFGLEVFDENGDKTVSIDSTMAILSSVEYVSGSFNSGVSRTYEFASFGTKAIVIDFTVASTLGRSRCSISVSGTSVTVTGLSGSLAFSVSLTVGVLK